jgi:hypothetical protein
LRAGIIEFAGLADNDGSGSDDTDGLKVSSLWHVIPVPSLLSYAHRRQFFILIIPEIQRNKTARRVAPGRFEMLNKGL